MTELGIGQKEILPQREKLSSEQLGSLISAVGNLEGKASTFLLMEHGRIYSKGNLYHEFMRAQGERIGWRPHRTIPFQYCQFSFLPIGLVAFEEIDPSLKTWGYGITPYGEKEGVPLAGLLLDFSERHPEFSLSQVFGSTSSPSQLKDIQTPEGKTNFKKRAPILRLKIFRELVRAELPIRELDLAYAVGENPATIGQHLARLADLHIIFYESTKRDQPYAFYKLSQERPNERPKQYSTLPSLTEKVYNFFVNLGPSRGVSPEDIADSLIYENPEMVELDKKALQSNIVGICSYLSRQKYLEQGKFKEGLQSEITLSDIQRAALLELVTLINRFQEQDPETLEEGKRKAMEIINDSERVSRLLKKTKQNSAHANRSSQERSKDYIRSLIERHPQATNTDLFNFQDRRPRLSRPTVRNVTRSLQRENRVNVSIRRMKKHFTAVDSEGEN